MTTSGFDYADYFGTIATLGDLLRDRPERSWLTAVPANPERKQFVVWLGCNILRTVHLVETLDDILAHLGVDYVMLGGPSSCCGITHQRQGDVATGRRIMGQTFDKFDAFRPERLLFWCPSCDQRLEDLGSDVTDLALQRQHVTEFLAERLDRFRFAPLARPLRIAMHAHGGTPQQDKDAAATRSLLSAIPNVEVVDVPAITELARFCSPSAIAALPPGRFPELIAETVAEARSHGVQTIATIYHGCHRELVGSEDAEDVIGGIRVENYLTLLARALGLPEQVDQFKRFKKIGDPDAILAELSPRIAALKLAPERARKAITAQFSARPAAATATR